MTPNRFPVALAAIALAACASLDADLRAARESWRGASYDEVVAAWGQPARSARDSHTWLSEDRPPERGAVSPGAGAGGAIFGAGSPGAPVRCDRTLMFRDGRAVDENWTGDPGFCKRFARRR